MIAYLRKFWPIVKPANKAIIVFAGLLTLFSVILFCIDPSFKAFGSLLSIFGIWILITGWSVSQAEISLLRLTLQPHNLIAPNPPKPTNTLPDGSLVWELTTDGDLHVTLREGEIFLRGKQLHPLVAKELTLNLMAALLAAVDYEDEEA